MSGVDLESLDLSQHLQHGSGACTGRRPVAVGLATCCWSRSEQARDLSKQNGPADLRSLLTPGCFETLSNTTAKLNFYTIVLMTNKACKSSKVLKKKGIA